MAAYVSAQPFWKRALAAVLDFVLAATVITVLLYQIFPVQRVSVTANGGTYTTVQWGPWPAVALVALLVAYFVVLGRTGGTVFQRVFGMQRVR